MSVTVAKPPRLLSLDVFRGLTVCFMIIVNNGSHRGFAPLEHAEWNGWTLTDLVFPFFLFITGASLTFSFASRLSDSSRRAQLPHILRRAAIIFAIGLAINAYPYYTLAVWRIPGVMQRIALCYLAASVLYLWTAPRTRWAIIAALLVGYWIALRFIPVPGFGIPTVDIPLLDKDYNLAAWLDRELMLGHLFEPSRDPEGLLSTLPAIATTLFGVATGEWIGRLRAEPGKLLRRLVLAGFACWAAGELWSLTFPINKKLWTSSYVLLTAGLAMLALAACYWLIDVKQHRGRWTLIPVVFGTNCIFAFTLSEFTAIFSASVKFMEDGTLVSLKDAFNELTFDNIPQPQWASFAYSLFFLTCCWFVTWLLYRRKIFLKV
jgi:predicted acyltransferase